MKKSSLQFELSLKISLFFIMIMLAVSSGTIAYLSNRYNKIIIDDMNSNLVNAVNTIDYYFDDVKTPMVMISRNSSIQKVLKNYQGMTNREKLDTVNQLEEFVQNITTFKSFINDIIVVGVNGYLYNIYRESPDKYIGDYDFLNSKYLADSSGQSDLLIRVSIRRIIICLLSYLRFILWCFLSDLVRNGSVM